MEKSGMRRLVVTSCGADAWLPNGNGQRCYVGAVARSQRQHRAQ